MLYCVLLYCIRQCILYCKKNLQGDLSRAFSEGGVDECQPHQFKYTASTFKFMKPFLPTNTRLLRKTTYRYIITTINKA